MIKDLQATLLNVDALMDQEIVILLSVAAAAKIANSCGCTEIIMNN